MSDVDSSPAGVIGRMWEAVYARDWDRIASFFTEDSIYYDVPTGPAAAGKGPEGIIKRLKIGLEDLTVYEHVEGVVVATGGNVMVEHAENWGWASGERVTLPFCSVHRVEGDKVLLWRDYWNYQTLMDGAPPTWEANLMAADTSWLFDATGLV